ncbi:MAG: efflux RND transporter periplasmic adaptor subunit [Verrucomicrobiota bacterium]
MSEETPKPASAGKDSPAPPPPGSAPKKGGGWLVLAILVVVCGMGVILFRVIANRPKAAPPARPVQVSTTTARQGDMGIYVEALGAVTPIATVTAPSQVSGQLTRVNFVEGQMVRAGDLLAEIDARPFQAQLDSAEGQLQRDQALLGEARIDLTRYQAAYEQKAIPKQQLDNQAALVEQDTGTVKYDQGLVDSAKVQLGYCHITSSIAGRVGLRLIDPGNIVQSSSTNGVVVITQLQPITVVFSVAEDYLPQIQRQLARTNHMTVQALDRAQQTNLATGSVLAMDNQIDSETGTIRLRAIFTNDDNVLFPSQFVNVKLLVDTLHGQTLIPASVVQRNGTNTFVYVLQEDNTVEMRTVKVGATDGEASAVEGVTPGEVLAADNFNRLQDKATVTPRRTDDAKKSD